MKLNYKKDKILLFYNFHKDLLVYKKNIFNWYVQKCFMIRSEKILFKTHFNLCLNELNLRQESKLA